MAGTTITPELITALAGLIAAITALVSVLLNRGKINETHSTVKTIAEQTNGTLAALQAKADALQEQKATPDELAARRPPASPA